MDPLRITVLGCSGTYAAAGEDCTSYLVQGAGMNVLLDCGPGALSNLQQHIALGDLHAVVVTHEHPDHCGELPVLQNAWQWGLFRSGLPVYGTAGTLAKVRAASSRDSAEPAFAWTTITEADRVAIGDLGFSFARTDHPVETLAVRVEHPSGASLAFTSDTGPDWSLSSLGQGIGLALCDATFTEATVPTPVSHMTCRQAAEMARDAQVGHLVLTHHWPMDDLDEHRSEAEAFFSGPVDVARRHVTYTVATPTD